MWNHNFDASCEWETDEGMVITATKNIKEGEELFISYGKVFTNFHILFCLEKMISWTMSHGVILHNFLSIHSINICKKISIQNKVS